MRVLPALFLIFAIGFSPAFGYMDSSATGESGGAHDAGFFDELIRAAYRESPELRAAYHRWRATLEQVPQAESLPDPVLGYGYFIERMETRQVFRVEQMIPGWGKRGLRGSVAEEAARVTSESLEAAAADVRLRVIQAASGYVLATQTVGRIEENLELVEQLHAVARQRYRAGDASQADVLRLESEADSLRFELKSWQERIEPLRAEVNAVLGRPPEASLPLAEGMPPLPVNPEVESGRIEEGVARNPDLRVAEAEIRRTERAADLARRDSTPDLMVGMEYMDNRGMAPDEVMAMVSVSIPVWQGRYRAQRREAVSDLRAARQNREGLFSQRKAEARMALYRTQDAIRQVDLFADSLLPRARQTLEILQTDYQGGNASFLDLIEAQRKVLELELGWLKARTDAVVASAEWERLAVPSDQKDKPWNRDGR